MSNRVSIQLVGNCEVGGELKYFHNSLAADDLELGEHAEAVKLALSDNVERGFEYTVNDEIVFMSPLAACKKYLIPKLESLLGTTMKDKNTGTECTVNSVAYLIEGEQYVSRTKVSSGTTIKNQQTKRMGRVVWNYALVTEDTGTLASLMIATRKGVQHSKRNK